MLISDASEVRELYSEAIDRKWVLPCLCSENLTTTEAILSAAKEFGEKYGISDVMITLAITCNYSHRSQAPNYSHTRDWKTGLKLFYADIDALAGKDSYFKNLRVMTHLDHIQYDLDEELLQFDLSKYSSIMFDASNLPFEQNIQKTAEFTKKRKNEIVIEGACDEIVDATGTVRSSLTTPKAAERYIRETGTDMIVANLGTEHRASGKELQYHAEVAREIKGKIGSRIVLHGASSATNEQLENLFEDGVIKVNVWTALERDSSPILFAEMVRNAQKVAGKNVTDMLIKDGLLTEKVNQGNKIDISNFTTMYRQDIIFKAMKNMVMSYLELWYKR